MRGRRIALELHCTVTLYAGLKEWILGDEAGCPERHQVRGSGCGVGLDKESAHRINGAARGQPEVSQIMTQPSQLEFAHIRLRRKGVFILFSFTLFLSMWT